MLTTCPGRTSLAHVAAMWILMHCLSWSCTWHCLRFPTMLFYFTVLIIIMKNQILTSVKIPQWHMSPFSPTLDCVNKHEISSGTMTSSWPFWTDIWADGLVFWQIAAQCASLFPDHVVTAQYCLSIHFLTHAVLTHHLNVKYVLISHSMYFVSLFSCTG